jgi:hypothetical protein
MMMPTQPLSPRSQREPVLVGEADIEHDERRQIARDEPAQSGAVADPAHAKTVPGEILAEHPALHRLVLDDDDMGPRGHGLPAGKGARCAFRRLDFAVYRLRCPGFRLPLMGCDQLI